MKDNKKKVWKKLEKILKKRRRKSEL